MILPHPTRTTIAFGMDFMPTVYSKLKADVKCIESAHPRCIENIHEHKRPKYDIGGNPSDSLGIPAYFPRER